MASPRTGKRSSSGHARSTSLPCPSHEAFSQLRSTLHIVSQNKQHYYSPPTSSWLLKNLDHLDLLLAGLHDILQLPKARLCLRRNRASAWTETLLNSFLLLADVYSRFRDSMISLKQLVSDAQVCLRRKDESGVEAAARSGKKVEKEVKKLLGCLRELGRSKGQEKVGCDDHELLLALKEVRVALCSASVAVFSGVVDLCSFSHGGLTPHISSSSPWTVMRRKGASSKGSTLKEIEEYILDAENGSIKVLSRLLNSRVLLLNIMEEAL